MFKSFFKFTLAIILLYAHVVIGQVPDGFTVSRVASGDYFTCIDTDDQGTIWLGTKKQGLQRADKLNDEFQVQQFSQGDEFNKYSLTSIKTKTQGYEVSIWCGSHRAGFSDRVSGGLNLFFKDGNGMALQTQVGRDPVYAAGIGLPKIPNGLPNRSCSAVHIDRQNNVWTTHGYDDLTVTGSQSFLINPWTGLLEIFGQKPGYYLRPGGITRKAAGSFIIKNMAIDQLPYPAWTINTPFDKSAQTRRFLSITSNSNEVWAGFYGYMANDESTFVPTGIARFGLDGQFIEYINHETAPELPLTESFASPAVVSLEATNEGDMWVGFNRSLGFAVFKNDAWTYINNLQHFDTVTQTTSPSTYFPNGIAIPFYPGFTADNIKSYGRRVFIGTNNGVLMYKGRGALDMDSSYYHINTSNGLSSNNVRSIALGKGGFVYVVTDLGVDELFIPSEISLFHIQKKETPYVNNDPFSPNYEMMASLNTDDENSHIEIENVPKFAVDGTQSSVFRYYTEDFDDFYDTDDYLFFMDNHDLSSDIDTLQYGKIRLRPKDKYERENPPYVDLVYTHPGEIEPNIQFVNDLHVFRVIYQGSGLPLDVFTHNVEFVLPPVLLVHGVWSTTASLDDLENYFVTQCDYEQYQILKIFKDAPSAEEPTHGDAHQVPNGIEKLIDICYANNLSAGKVSVVAHSRGGLNTRAYIEEVDAPGKEPLKYRHDIHSLITLNTPHAGSQLGNLTLDQRPFTVYVPIAEDIFNLGGKVKPSLVPKTKDGLFNHNKLLYDQVVDDSKKYLRYGIEKFELRDFFGLGVSKEDLKDRNGSRQLLVDGGYVEQLNENDNLNKLAEYEVPIHAIATNYRPCHFTGCPEDIELVHSSESLGSKVISQSKKLGWLGALITLKKFFNMMAYADPENTEQPKTVDGLLRSIFNGEDSDMIVPESSMEAGLPDEFVSRFEERNIAHIDLSFLAYGVTTDPEVAARIFDLHLQNPHASGSSFSINGIDPPRGASALKVTFKPETLSEWLYHLTLSPRDSSGKSSLPDDASFTLLPEDSLTRTYTTMDSIFFSIQSSGMERALVVFEKETPDFKYEISLPMLTLTGNDQLGFIIPETFAGFSTIKAYAFKDGKLLLEDKINLYTELSEDVILSDFQIAYSQKNIKIPVHHTHEPNITALLEDSTQISLNGLEGLVQYITDTTIAKIINQTEIIGITPGIVYYVSAYGEMIDSLMIKVVENPNLEKTLLTKFDIVSTTDESIVALDWATSQEFNCREFIIERRLKDMEYEEIATIPAHFTKYERSEYQFIDTNQLITSREYRIKIVGLDDTFEYSQTLTIIPRSLIEVNIHEVEDSNNPFLIAINPANSNNLSAIYDNSGSSTGANISVFNVKGQTISSQSIALNIGTNQIKIDLPNYITPGIYFIRLQHNDNLFTQRVTITD